MVAAAPCVVMTDPLSGLRVITDEEIQARRAGQLNFGSGGPASFGHVCGEMMRKKIKLNLLHVQHRGGAPMSTDLISGMIPMGIDAVTADLPLFKSGQLIPLAVTSANRAPLLPDVPSITELYSYRKLVIDNFFGLSGPAKIPLDVMARINGACDDILAQADIKNACWIWVPPLRQLRLPHSQNMCMNKLPLWRP